MYYYNYGIICWKYLIKEIWKEVRSCVASYDKILDLIFGAMRNHRRVSLQFSSVMQLCLTLCNLIDCSMTGLFVHHQLPEFTQTHVHLVGDIIQTSHPLSSPSPPAFNLSQHKDLFLSQLFTLGGQNTGASALVSFLPMNIQDWFPLGLTCVIFLQSNGLSRIFSNTTVQKH